MTSYIYIYIHTTRTRMRAQMWTRIVRYDKLLIERYRKRSTVPVGVEGDNGGCRLIKFTGPQI